MPDKTKKEERFDLVMQIVDRLVSALEALAALDVVEAGVAGAAGKTADDAKPAKVAKEKKEPATKVKKPKKITKKQMGEIKLAACGDGELTDELKDKMVAILKEDFDCSTISELDGNRVAEFIAAIGTADVGTKTEDGDDDDPLAGM